MNYTGNWLTPRRSTALIWLPLVLTLGACAHNSEVVPPICPAPPRLPTLPAEMMMPIKPDFRQRMSEWLYGSPLMQMQPSTDSPPARPTSGN